VLGCWGWGLWLAAVMPGTPCTLLLRMCWACYVSCHACAFHCACHNDTSGQNLNYPKLPCPHTVVSCCCRLLLLLLPPSVS
jgi:hypothetical protein